MNDVYTEDFSKFGFRELDEAGKLSSTDSRVLIYGPTGSGKELVARKFIKIQIVQKILL